jgi:hypothetical protein
MSNHLLALANTCLGSQQKHMLQFATYGYEHLISEGICTPEIYNNSALSKIINAQQLCIGVYNGLKLPLIVDQSSLMYETSGTKGPNDTGNFIPFLQEGLKLLNHALEIDPGYWPASLNKCIILLGLEEFKSCERELAKVQALKILESNKTAKKSIAEIRALMLYLRGDSAAGVKLLDNLAAEGSQSARFNSVFIKNAEFEPMKMPAFRRDTLEKWNNTMIYPWLKNVQLFPENVLEYNNNKANILVDSTKEFTIIELKPVGYCPLRSVMLATSTDTKRKTSGNISIGSSLEQVLKAYPGKPVRISGTVYTYYIFPESSLMFLIDNNSSKVSRWMYYNYY